MLLIGRFALLIGLVLGGCSIAFADEPGQEPPSDGLRVRIMTFNIRYGTAPDGENKWPRRRDLVTGVIRDADCDFIGVQEALRFQLDRIRETVPGLGMIGVGRDDGKEQGEHAAILYRSSRWTPQAGGTFWLSDTPEQAGSRSFGNNIPRIVTWGRFIERPSGRGVYVFNTHFDHQSQPSRVSSAQLLARQIGTREFPDPVLVTGDFNVGEHNPAIQVLERGDGQTPVTLVDSFRVLHPTTAEVGTFNGFAGRNGGEKIDYVFVQPEVGVIEAAIVRTQHNRRYPSDHYPVLAEVSLPEPAPGSAESKSHQSESQTTP